MILIMSKGYGGRPSFTLRGKMLLLFGTVFFLSMVALGLISVYGVPFIQMDGMNNALRKEAIRDLSQLADIKKGELLLWMAERRGDIRLATESSFLREHINTLCGDILKPDQLTGGKHRKRYMARDDYKLVYDHLKSLENVYGSYDEIMVADADTWTIAVSLDKSDIGRELTGDERFPDILKPERDEIIRVIKDPLTGKPYLYIARAIKSFSSDGEDRTTAVIIAKIDAAHIISGFMLEKKGLGETEEINLIDRNGNHITTPKYPMPGMDKAGHSMHMKLARPAMLALDGIEGIITDSDYRGVRVLAATRHIPLTVETAWGMVVKIDEQEVFAPMRRNILLYLSLSVLGALIVLGLTYIIAKRLSVPLEKLSRTVRKIEAGDLKARSSVTTSDEIGALSSSFNSMADEIQRWNEELEQKVMERTDDLKDSEEKIRAVSETSMDAIIMMDDQGVISYFNPAAVKMFGYSRDEAEGRALHDFLVSEEARKEYHQRLPEFSKTGYCIVVGKLMEVTATRRDGARFPVELTVSSLIIKGQWHAVGTIRDITERRRAEDALKKVK